MRPCDIMFEELTLRLSRPDNIRFVGEWVLPFDPNVVLVVTLDVIFLDGLAFVRFCTFLTPHQINGTEFLEKSLHNLSSIIFPPVYTKLHEMVIQTLSLYPKIYLCLDLPLFSPEIPDSKISSGEFKLTSISHSALGSSSFLIVKDFPVRKFLEAFPLE